VRVGLVLDADLRELAVIDHRQVHGPGDVIFGVLVRRPGVDHQRVGREVLHFELMGMDQARRCLDGGRHVRGDVGLMILRRKSSQLRTSAAPTLTHAPALSI